MPTPKGFKHSEESKRKISEGQRRFYRMKIEAEPPQEQEIQYEDKTCAKCGKTKPVSEFYVKKRRLKCGLIHAYPVGRCKVCKRAEFKARYDKLKAEGRAKEIWARNAAKRDKEKLREYGREWAAAKRRSEGAKSNGPWTKYRQEEGVQGKAREEEILPAAPLADFLKEEVARKGKERVGEEVGNVRRLYAFLHAEYETTKLAVVDNLLTRMGRPEMLLMLYPVEEEKPLYGYFKP